MAQRLQGCAWHSRACAHTYPLLASRHRFITCARMSLYCWPGVRMLLGMCIHTPSLLALAPCARVCAGPLPGRLPLHHLNSAAPAPRHPARTPCGACLHLWRARRFLWGRVRGGVAAAATTAGGGAAAAAAACGGGVRVRQQSTGCDSRQQLGRNSQQGPGPAAAAGLDGQPLCEHHHAQVCNCMCACFNMLLVDCEH